MQGYVHVLSLIISSCVVRELAVAQKFQHVLPEVLPLRSFRSADVEKSRGFRDQHVAVSRLRAVQTEGPIPNNNL